MDTGRYAFKVEWFDQVASLKRHYQLFYTTRMDGAHEIELIDCKTRRTFLKRCHYPSVSLDDIFIGAKVTIYARQMLVLDYLDESTRRALEKEKARCCAAVTPSGMSRLGSAWKRLNDEGLKVAKLKTVAFEADEAVSLFGSPAMSGGTSVVMELVGPDVVRKWQSIADSMGADFNGALSADAANASLEAVFGDPRGRVPSAARSTARLDNCTCAIILPHAVAKGMAGPVLDDVFASGLEVTAMELFDVDLVAAEEFLEVYKGVVPEYVEMARELSGTTLLAIELCGADAVTRFREVAGPRDVDFARRIRPHTIRAKYGRDTVRCAVHATDLAEDGPIESEYWFSIMQ